MYPDTTSVFHPVNNDISTLEIAKKKLRKQINVLSLYQQINSILNYYLASQLAAQRALYLPPLYVSNYYASTYMNDFACISNTALQTRAKCRSYASGLHSGAAFNIGFP